MKKELYVVYFESANFAGYGEYCLVWAVDEEDAFYAASDYAEEFLSWASIMEAYPLSSEKGLPIRGYLSDEKQKQFYPIVN